MSWRENRLKSAVNGENPTVLVKMKSGFAVIGDTQFLPGYCVLLAYPKTDSLNQLTLKRRSDFLVDMSLIGDAITAVCKPKRINYEILGNTDIFLHAHIFPRYEWEEEERKSCPVWLYPKENWRLEKYQFNEEWYGELKKRLTLKLKDLIRRTKIGGIV